MNIKLYLLSTLLTGGFVLNSSAQVSYNKRAMGLIGTAPNAGNFQNGATLDDVDKSTGTLRVGIPLYEIKVNDISVPITLNYTATGIKVGQEAGVAGMGWDLSAGGKIITNVNGKRDDASNGISGYHIPEPFNYQATASTSVDPTHKSRFNDMIDGKQDNAWDIYTYILPHGGGTYTANGLTYPYDPFVKIDHAHQNITTDDGLVYNFTTGDVRKTTKIINYPSDVSTIPPIQYNLVDNDPLQWWDYDLHSITSTRFKDVVNFKYEQISGPYNITKLAAKKRYNTSETLPLYRDVPARSDVYGGGVDITLAHQYKIIEPIISRSFTDYIQHTRLDTIDFSTGMVVFNYNVNDVLGRDQLDSIKIYKKENNTLSLLKKYEFVYFGDKQYGHYLAGIKNYDSKNVYQDGWQFAYNGFLNVVPNSESKAQDRWGFYNARLTNKTLLEDPTKNYSLALYAHYPINGSYIHYTRQENIDFYTDAGDLPPATNTQYNVVEHYIYFANREFNEIAAASGILTSVTTPTGAVYEYGYGPHTGTTWNPHTVTGYNIQGGGFRVQSIIKRRGHSGLYYGASTSESDIKKTYEYGNAEYNDGVNSPNVTNKVGQIAIPQTILGNTSAYFHTGHVTNDTDPYNYDFINNLLLVSHPINNLDVYKGSYAMYQSVTETLFKGENSSQSHGKTVYYSHFPLFDPYQSGWLLNANGGSGLTYNSPAQLSADPAYFPAPFFAINPGISIENGAGIYAIVKLADNGSGSFRPIEVTQYNFQFYSSPQNSTNHLVSMYAGLTGQLSGAYPTNQAMPTTIYNNPLPYNQGGATLYAFDNYTSSGGNGLMNYLTATMLLNQGYTEDYPGKYATRMIDLNAFSFCMRKTKEVTTNLNDLTNTVIDYHYQNLAHMQPTFISKTSGSTDTTFTRLYYPFDYGTSRVPSNFAGSGGMLDQMKNLNMGLSEPFLTYTSVKTGNGIEKATGGTATNYKLWDSSILPDKSYKVIPPDNMAVADLPFFDGVGMATGSGAGGSNSIFKQQISYDTYHKGQVHQYTEGILPSTGANTKSNIILWGYNNQFPIAKVTNAGNIDPGNYLYSSGDVAYTSFETKDTCNWIYPGNPVADPTTVSGKSVYPLSAGAIAKVNATVSGKYIVSYWYKSGSAISISGCTAGAAVVKNTLGPWILAEQEVSNVTGAVTVSGSGYIDELRFYPKASQMTTYLYDPLIGLTCTFDANGKPQYYEYDNSQRLSTIRDHNGNIIKAYKYIIGSAN